MSNSSFTTRSVDILNGIDAGKNYAPNPNFEDNIIGWSAFNTTFTNNKPGTITASSTKVTLSRITSNVLSGAGDLQFAISDYTSSAGHGMISDVFTLEDIDLAKILQLSCAYKTTSGSSGLDMSGTSTSTLEWWIYNVGAADWIQPSGFRGMVAKDIPAIMNGCEFQTDSRNTSNYNQYRIALIIRNSATANANISISKITCARQAKTYGSPITDWQSFTPTGSWSTNTTYTGKYKDVGDVRKYLVKVSLSGAPTAATALTINLNCTIDTNKVLSTSQNTNAFGVGQINDAGTASYPCIVNYNDSTSVRVNVFISSGTYTNETSITDTVPFTFGNTDFIEVQFEVPRLGASSSVVMSSDADTRIVSFKGYVPSNQALTANTTNLPITVIKDSHNAFSTDTYTIKTQGDYVVSMTLITTSASGSIYVYKNGSVLTGGALGTINNTAWVSGSVLVENLKAGDTLSLRSNATLTILGDTGTAISIQKLSGPSQISASDSVSCSYTNSAGTAFSATGVNFNVPFATKEYDSHGSFSSSTFTAPISGEYDAEMMISPVFTSVSAGNDIIDLFIVTSGSGSNAWYRSYYPGNAPNSSINSFTVRKSFKLLAGQTLTFTATGTYNAGSVSLYSDARVNYANVKRVGNY